jgi:ribosomal protein S18 acetylase RimI-like enzyme
MLQTRRAVPEDAALIAAHRKAMFLAMGGHEGQVLEIMRQSCEPWVRRMIQSERYFGWIVTDDETPVASAGLMLMDWPPHPLDPTGETRGYLLNVFVDPDYRRRGVARELVEACMSEARQRDIRIVTLHASDAGRSVYDQVGFRQTNEMMYRNPGADTTKGAK